jgi:hypothetical protein
MNMLGIECIVRLRICHLKRIVSSSGEDTYAQTACPLPAYSYLNACLGNAVCFTLFLPQYSNT